MHLSLSLSPPPPPPPPPLAVKASVNVKVLDVSPPYWRIFKQIWVHALSVFIVFAVTLSLFPAVISIIESNVPKSEQTNWTGE